MKLRQPLGGKPTVKTQSAIMVQAKQIRIDVQANLRPDEKEGGMHTVKISYHDPRYQKRHYSSPFDEVTLGDYSAKLVKPVKARIKML